MIVLQIEVADFPLFEVEGEAPVSADGKAPRPGTVALELVHPPPRRPSTCSISVAVISTARMLRSRFTRSGRISRASSSSTKRKIPLCRILRILISGMYGYTVRLASRSNLIRETAPCSSQLGRPSQVAWVASSLSDLRTM